MFLRFLVMVFFLLARPVLAQELPPPPDEENNPELTGNLPDPEDNPEDFQAEENTSEENGTHTLKFEFTSVVTFQNPGDPSPYIEIHYNNSFETTVRFGKRTQAMGVSADIETQNWGSLAQNEFFECRLNIALQDVSVNVETRMNEEASEDDPENPVRQGVIKILYSDTMAEDWFSYCTDIGGATLNTLGAPEHYNNEILKMIQPSLSAIVIDNFDPTTEQKVELNVEPTLVEDKEISNTILLSGSGMLTITPLENTPPSSNENLIDLPTPEAP